MGYFTEWFTEWLSDCWVALLIDLLTDLSTHWPTDCSLNDPLSDWVIDGLLYWLTYWQTNLPTNQWIAKLTSLHNLLAETWNSFCWSGTCFLPTRQRKNSREWRQLCRIWTKLASGTSTRTPTQCRWTGATSGCRVTWATSMAISNGGRTNDLRRRRRRRGGGFFCDHT